MPHTELMFMEDLYKEILKDTTKTIEQFSEQIAIEPEVRDNFLQEFVDEIVDSMDIKDIVRAYSNQILQDLYKQCDNNEEEAIVNECAETFPYVLERFNVNVPQV